ncbi:MAG: hypothetical protein DMG70_30835 [Acidobacteria bacterium]|nr:MAG: hypothetical protein DMG70_30835 [Acidobacteriota bacterium]
MPATSGHREGEARSILSVGIGNVFCSIEVKTRTSRDVKPAEAAVDNAKRQELTAVAREYLRPLPPSCQWRCDVVNVYYEDQHTARPEIELFKKCFLHVVP